MTQSKSNPVADLLISCIHSLASRRGQN